MGVVAKRPQQRHCDTLSLIIQQRAQDLAGTGLIQWRDHGALGGHPLVQLTDRRARHEGRRLARRADVEHTVDRESGGAAGTAHHAERVGVAGGGHQRHLRAPALDQQVGPDRGAVAEPLGLAEQLLGANSDSASEGRERLEYPLGGIAVVRRERLGVVKPSLRIDPHAVGEGAADVNADGPGHGSPLISRYPATPGSARGRHQSRSPAL